MGEISGKVTIMTGGDVREWHVVFVIRHAYNYIRLLSCCNRTLYYLLSNFFASFDVTVHQHYAETQDRRLRGSETGSTLPSYVSDTVKY